MDFTLKSWGVSGTDAPESETIRNRGLVWPHLPAARGAGRPGGRAARSAGRRRQVNRLARFRSTRCGARAGAMRPFVLGWRGRDRCICRATRDGREHFVEEKLSTCARARCTLGWQVPRPDLEARPGCVLDRGSCMCFAAKEGAVRLSALITRGRNRRRDGATARTETRTEARTEARTVRTARPAVVRAPTVHAADAGSFLPVISSVITGKKEPALSWHVQLPQPFVPVPITCVGSVYYEPIK